MTSNKPAPEVRERTLRMVQHRHFRQLHSAAYSTTFMRLASPTVAGFFRPGAGVTA